MFRVILFISLPQLLSILVTCMVDGPYNGYHQESYVIIPSDDNDIFSLQVSKLNIHLTNNNNNNNKTLHGFLAVVKGVASSNFRVLVRNSECSLLKTSSFAYENGCAYAINGGPFQSYLTGGCIGLVISEGEIIHSPSNLHGSDNVGFGMSYDNRWVIGNFDGMVIEKNNNFFVNEQNHHVQLKEYVSGLYGWLIKDNMLVPEPNNVNKTKNTYAPRTAIGVNSDGNLLFFQIDGCEKCYYRNEQLRGLTLYQMAKVMASPQINATYAINMDGGGSSISVWEGEVINHPTCLDYFDWKCERQVTSAICIQNDKRDEINNQKSK